MIASFRIRSLLCVAPVALTLGLAAAPVSAAWETIHGAAIRDGSNCSDPHSLNTGRTVVFRSTGDSFNLPLGFNNEVEIYGHGIDLSPSARLEQGGEAQITRRVVGAVNSKRGCGNIGSVVVRITLDDSARATTTRLLVGSEVIPVELVAPRILDTRWSERSSMGPSGVPRPPGNPPPPAPPPPPPPPAQAGGPTTGCGAGGGRGCGGNSGASVIPGTSRQAPVYTPDTAPGLGACIVERGGQFVLAQTSLQITLPRLRGDAAVQACLQRPVFFETRLSENLGSVGGIRALVGYQFPVEQLYFNAPVYRGNTVGLVGPTVLPGTDRNFQSVAMTADFVANFVGEKRAQLAPTTPVPGANPLTLVIRTDPAIGIGEIRFVGAGAARVSSTVRVRFDWAARPGTAAATAQWEVRGGTATASPQACFRATSARVNATVIGEFDLVATEQPGCDTAPFTVFLAPIVDGAPLPAAPYARSAPLVLGALTAPRPTLPQTPGLRPTLGGT